MASYYKVQQGDTLSEIAERFNTSVSKLASLNQIANIHKISVGQMLRLPSGSNAKDYDAIGKQMEVCLNDIENLPSFQRFLKMV